MGEPLRLMAVLAHPDDETLGVGGTLARYSSEGVETYVVTATKGQAGRHGEGDHPGRAEVGRMREGELRAAGAELGVHQAVVLDYMDGALAEAEPLELISDIAEEIVQVRPQVVISFAHDGAYGHPDHIAISQATTGAVMAAGPDGGVRKLYHMAWGEELWAAYQSAFKTLTSTVDGTVRRANPWPEWSITTRIDARPWWRQVWSAVQCHVTQMGIYRALDSLTEEQHETLWGDQTFYRVMSTVNGGRAVETDLFEGLR